MASVAGTPDWADMVDAIVQRAPKLPERNSLAAQVRLLALLGSAAPLDVLLAGLSSYVETWAEEVLCSVMLVDELGGRLLLSAAPSLPTAYTTAVRMIPIGIGQGSCGTAAATRATVIVADVERSDHWTAYAPLAVSHGLHACWSVPVFDDAGVLLGTLALYCRTARAPTPRELDLIRFAASLAAFVVQRHRDAERLRANEVRLSAAIWGTAIGLWEYSPESGCRWLNAWPARFEVDPSFGRDVLQSWHERMHPDDLARYQRTDDLIAQNTVDTYSIDYRISDRERQWRWVHERGKVMARAADGTPTRCVGACLDIDDHKRTEAALRKAEQLCELAIDATRLPMWEYDVPSDTLRGNVYWHHVVGYQLSEAEAQRRTESWLSNVHPDDAPNLARMLKQPYAGATGFYQTEFRIQLPDGQYKWLLDRARVVERDVSGAPLKLVGISVDIDAHKHMESALRASQQNLATALWGAQAAYWTTDLKTNVTAMSDSFFEITGIERTAWEAAVEPWCNWVHPDDAATGCARYRDHLEGRTAAYEFEYRLRTPGGWKWLLDRGRVTERDAQGRPLRISGTSLDVSACRPAEPQELRAEPRPRHGQCHCLPSFPPPKGGPHPCP